jgi:hypothetical protein
MQDKKMEQKKSGIYMDRMDGALPQNRVSKYYQDTNPKDKEDKDAKETFSKKSTPIPKPGMKGYNEMIAAENAKKKAGAESGIIGTIKKYAKAVDKYVTGTSGAAGSGF